MYLCLYCLSLLSTLGETLYKGQEPNAAERLRFYEDRCSEGCPLFVGINELTCTRVPRNCMTFCKSVTTC